MILCAVFNRGAELINAGDQGFLNSYYADFANSRVYEPDSPLTPEPETQRLSTLYNADVGLYMLANKVIFFMCTDND